MPTQVLIIFDGRNVLFGRWMMERATALDLAFIEVSGMRTAEENAERVARHLSLRP